MGPTKRLTIICNIATFFGRLPTTVGPFSDGLWPKWMMKTWSVGWWKLNPFDEITGKRWLYSTILTKWYENVSPTTIGMPVTMQRHELIPISDMLSVWCDLQRHDAFSWYIFYSLQRTLLHPKLGYALSVGQLSITCIASRVPYKLKQTPATGTQHLDTPTPVSVPREVGICVTPALTCSKWEFVNWAPIPESTARVWNWPCTNWEWCSWWESYVIPLHSAEIAVC